jgi:hypothetical protein
MEGSTKLEAHETTKHLERIRDARSIKLIIVIKKLKAKETISKEAELFN